MKVRNNGSKSKKVPFPGFEPGSSRPQRLILNHYTRTAKINLL